MHNQQEYLKNIYPRICLENLLDRVDAVSIVTPTRHHSSVAKLCIERGKHVFIEKPITQTLEQADKLLKIAKQKNVLIQVGHIERLNPALTALKPFHQPQIY